MPTRPDAPQRLPLRQLRQLFYITRWLPRYERADLRGDLAAGLTTGVMLIPQSMAYSILAGLPPVYGLYASLVPLLVYPLFGTARHVAIGTIAIDMLIVAAGLAPLAERGTDRYIELAILLAFLVGALQLLMGVARLGFIVNLLSRPVIAGFMSAAALIIVFGQLENLLGLSLPQTQYVHVILWHALRGIAAVEPPTLALGLSGILLLVGLQRWKPLLPAPLVAVVLGTAAVWGFDLARHGIAIVGHIPTGLPVLRLPAFEAASMRALLSTAVTLALVQFMTLISLGKVMAGRHGYTIQANRELVALGGANLFGSLFRAIPVSGSFSRSAVAVQAGARTPLANVVSACLIALTLLLLTPLFYYLPVPILAAIIMVAAFGLFDPREIAALFRIKRVDGALALLTFLATLLIGIQQGILIGVGASVVAVMYRISRPYVAVLGHLPGTRSFRDVRRYPEARPIEGLLMLRIDASFSFANAEFVKDLILRWSQQQGARAVVLDASSINDLDTTAAAVLGATADALKASGVAFYLAGVKERVQDVMVHAGLYDRLGADHFFLSPYRATEHFLTRWGRSTALLQAGADGPAGPAPPDRVDPA